MALSGVEFGTGLGDYPETGLAGDVVEGGAEYVAAIADDYAVGVVKDTTVDVAGVDRAAAVVREIAGGLGTSLVVAVVVLAAAGTPGIDAGLKSS
jgi:hypothetical protein